MSVATPHKYMCLRDEKPSKNKLNLGRFSTIESVALSNVILKYQKILSAIVLNH